MSLVDFTNSEYVLSNLDGNAEKIEVLHDGTYYILKFGEHIQPDEKKPLQGSYCNTPFSEWMGSHVFQALGIPTHETYLGTYKNRFVVACKDFIKNRVNASNFELIPFDNLERNIIESSKRPSRSPLLSNIEHVFEHHPSLVDLGKEASERYWDMFVVDALLANFDRHGGNWGYIADTNEGKLIELAPIYDCGSTFAPRLSEYAMFDLIGDYATMCNRSLDFPRARLQLDVNKNAKYQDVLLGEHGIQARNSLIRLADSICNLDIASIASSAGVFSKTRIEYYTAMVDSRIDTILQPAYELACREHNLEPKKLIAKHSTLRDYIPGFRTSNQPTPETDKNIIEQNSMQTKPRQHPKTH